MLLVVVVVVAVRCRKLISAHCRGLLAACLACPSALPEANQHTVVDYWSLFGLFIGSVRRLPAEANQHTVVDSWRGLAPSWLALALLLACLLARFGGLPPNLITTLWALFGGVWLALDLLLTLSCANPLGCW